jgi:hypothetical protein
MTTHTHPINDDVPPYPEMVGDVDDQADARQFTPEADDVEVDEDGYGYGV